MTFSIANQIISQNSEPFIIAEAGINHNGELETAIKLIDAAKYAGADAVKFQTFKASEFCGDPEQLFTYFSQGKEVTEPMIEMFERMELSEDDWRTIKLHSDSIGITFFSTPQNESDLDFLLSLGIPAIKIGSDDLTNIPLISRYSSEGLPLILSTGMANLGEVDEALFEAGWPQKQDISVLVCTSEYPTPSKDVNISRIKSLRAAFPGLIVGFSDHTEGNTAAIMASSLGAQIFEKHFTLDHNMVGPDHWFSPDVEELKSWVDSIRASFLMRGTGQVVPSVKELEMRTLARRSVVAIADIAVGEEFSASNTALRRPGNGLPPKFLSNVIGKISKRKIQLGELIQFEDLS